jgi:hypothetical protein
MENLEKDNDIELLKQKINNLKEFETLLRTLQTTDELKSLVASKSQELIEILNPKNFTNLFPYIKKNKPLSDNFKNRLTQKIEKLISEKETELNLKIQIEYRKQ